jgi:hypothetical protein
MVEIVVHRHCTQHSEQGISSGFMSKKNMIVRKNIDYTGIYRHFIIDKPMPDFKNEPNGNGTEN